MKTATLRCRCLAVAAMLACCGVALAQAGGQGQGSNLPAISLAALAQANAVMTPPAPATEAQQLTLAQAERLALKNNPRVSVAHLLALAQHQVEREARSGELPTALGSVTAEDAELASRISAGSLTASRLFTHAGAGAGFTQLITDFGHTPNLVVSARLEEKAQDARALATDEDIVLVTDQAFFHALQAQALLQVARQNVAARGTTDAQVGQMTKNKLKSTLDLSFADVNLSQAKLLQLDAQDNEQATMAALDAVLGLDTQVEYDLVDTDTPLVAPPGDEQQEMQIAFQQRPDLEAQNLSRQAAEKYSHAERDQMLPTISALGTAGTAPIRPDQYYVNNWWGAIGVNMNVPLFNGFLYSSQAKEASIRAEAAAEQSRDLRDQIARDVRTAWLAANTAYQRVSVTADLLKEANLALQLAQTRYQLGLSSIVELSEAQYQQTDAAIGHTDAQYQYKLALAELNYQTGATP